MSFKNGSIENSITLNSRGNDIWELVPVSDETLGIFNGREVMVYGFESCEYGIISNILSSQIGKEKVYNCRLGYFYTQDKCFSTLDGRRIEVLSEASSEQRLCKDTLTNIVLENFKRQYLGLELVSLLFVVQSDQSNDYFKPSEIIKKKCDDDDEKLYTNSELRRLYKLCNDLNNPILEKIAKKTVCFAKIKLVDDATKKYEISTVEDPFWIDQEWVDLWTAYNKSKKKDPSVSSHNWRLNLLEKVSSFKKRMFEMQNDEWVRKEWPNHLLHIDCYLQHGLELDVLKNAPKEVQEVIINNIGSFVSIVAADGYSETNFTEEIKEIPETLNEYLKCINDNCVFWYNSVINAIIEKASEKIVLEIVEQFGGNLTNPIQLKYPYLNSNLHILGNDKSLLQEFKGEYKILFNAYGNNFISNLMRELKVSEDNKKLFVESMVNKLNKLNTCLYRDMKKIVLKHPKDVQKLLTINKSFLDANNVAMDVQVLFKQEPDVLRKILKLMYLFNNHETMPFNAFFPRFMNLILEIPGFISFNPLTAVNEGAMDTSD